VSRRLVNYAAAPALLVAALLPAVLAFRWGPSAGNWGEQLMPWPDAGEYAAGAQSLAETGRYFLRIGPWEVQPRYPPGFSMLIAPALVLGLPGDQLWRVAAFFEWGLVALLLLGTRTCVLRLAPDARVAAGLAGAGAAATWLAAPMISTHGSSLMSDQPTLLIATLGGLAAHRAHTSRRAVCGWCLVAGLAMGLTTAMRLAEGILLAGSILVLLCSRRASPTPRLARASCVLLLGAGLGAVSLFTCWILDRSGFPPTRWSTYALWEPENFYSLDRVFSHEHAFEGTIPLVDASQTRRRVPNAQVVTQVLLGVPGLLLWEYVGYFWPAVGLIAAVWLARALMSRSPPLAAFVRAAGAWSLAHVALALVFIWPTPRILLSALLLQTLALWTAIGVAWSRRRLAKALAGTLAVTMIIASLWLIDRRLGSSWRHEDLNAATRNAVAAWLEASQDGEPAPVPFDSVRAQALGLLSGRDIGTLRWGDLRETWHFRVLRHNGYLCYRRGYGWHLDDVLRPVETSPPPANR